MLQKIKCFLGQHTFLPSRYIFPKAMEIMCVHCNKEFIKHRDIDMLIPMTDRLKKDGDAVLEAYAKIREINEKTKGASDEKDID